MKGWPDSEEPPCPSGHADNEPFRRIVWPFAIAETLVWAAYYYSFPALLPIWEADLGFTKTTLTGAFTLSLIVSAALAPLAGRYIDSGHGRAVFAGSASLAGVLLFLLSHVTEAWQFFAVWIGIGIAMAGSLYEACFAILTHCMGDRAKRAITLVTLVAGFAGTVSFPAAHYLTLFIGWRGTVAMFATTVLLICVPLILYGCHFADRRARIAAPKASTNVRQAMRAARTLTFWMLGVSFTLLSLDHALIISHLLPIMADRGLLEQTAVLAASMIGPMQVAGRLAMIVAERYVSTLTICLVSYISMGTAGGALYLAGTVPALVCVFVVFQGAAVGVLSIIRPAVIAELLGRRDFGVTSGLLAVGFMGGFAVAPILASLIWRAGGYDLVLILPIGVPIVALFILLLAWRFRQEM